MKNKITLVALLIFVIVVGILNFRIYNSYVDQRIILGDINTGTTNYLDKSDNMEVDFPNFSVTSMNLKSIKVKYLLIQEKFDEAQDLVNSIKYDPLKMSETQKAEIFLAKQDIDSLYISSKIAFEGLPLNQAHLIWYLKALALKNKNTEIIELYNTYKERVRTPRWFYFYFTTAYGIMNEENSDIIKRQAKEILNSDKHKEMEELNIILYYIVYGENNFKEHIKFVEDAKNMFDASEYIKAAKLYKNAFERFPYNIDSYYNQMASLFKANNFNETIDLYEILPDSINPKNGKFEFLVARAYLNIGDSISSCKFFKKSNRLNFKSAKSYYINLCEK